ncbi:hypothetical protein MKW94_006218, partial [Papaver nudicaule]|nr:hypothetical protein [Papaver nudicaule]
MGAGRKTGTIPLQERVERNPTVNCNVMARSLRKNDLGAVIFGCTSYTIQECLSNQIFGLPATHFSYVKNIKPGMPLFLFNYSAQQLFGVYEAAGNGEMNINPHGWSENGQEQTQYPAQVRICIRKECKPLLEYQYRPILKDNYYSDDHFWFELDHAQTGRLVSKFESSPLVVSKVVSKYPWSAPKQRRTSKHDKKVKCEDSWETISDSIVTQINPHDVGIGSQDKLSQYSSNWNVLQDMNSDPGENKVEDPGSADSEHDTPWDERTDFVLASSSTTPCEDENKQNLEPVLDKVEEENEEELVYRKLLQLVNEREKANCDSMGDKENVGLNESSVNFDCEPEVPLVNSEKHEMVSTNSSDAHFFSPTSSDVQSIVNQ